MIRNSRLFSYGVLGVFGGAVLLLTGLAGILHPAPLEIRGENDTQVLPIPAPVDLTNLEWDVIRHPNLPAPVELQRPLDQRFRLAGTFFAYAGDQVAPPEDARRAILDDVAAGRQHLVREGERVGEIDVVHIDRESIVLRDERGEERLFLSFTESEVGQPAPDLAGATGVESTVPLRFEDMPSIEENRFGRRIAENRWIMDREAVLLFADEMQEDPERLTALLMAMQPDLDEADQIQGFVLDMLGEDELYEAAGFVNGDVVRMVNSMPMTSPARAAYFIREFLTGNISALVFDIERNGVDQKLIHLIR